MVNPFKPETKIGQTFEILSDLEPHCARHQLPSSNPQRLIKELRDRGYIIETEPMYCDHCQSEETHDRLVSLDPHEGEPLPPRLIKPQPQQASARDWMRLRSGVRALHRGMRERDWKSVEAGVGIVEDYVARMRG